MMQVGFISAFVAGLLAFISPCILPLIPVYLGMMSGRAVYPGSGAGNSRGKVSQKMYLFINSILFVLGFSVVFIVLGSTATALGRLMGEYSSIITRIGGVILIVFGLHYAGLFKIRFLNFEKRFNMPESIRSGYLGSFFFGIIFSFGWIPCVGMILSGILLLASQLDTLLQGVALLAVFSAGLGIPFIIASIFISFFSGFLKKLNRHLNIVSIISGVFIIILGIIFVTDSMTLVIGFLSRYVPFLNKMNF
ncbi:MAG: cytochrome c biogenesis protein CcdA [Actinobacteria bacterium]|nr:cytochrome c biogenesis protein CcdA [Actinomycetota bacterium]